ncbi:hypothetical protein Cni_G09158 [Canna indica]|uniref:Uncharacterized protein n=1 Tax=Canna indica TaxID=4628 RepID=A0AAQ3K1U6_9LILI|nr:hypothetical protein Cni_G09158 [Canna indica]
MQLLRPPSGLERPKPLSIIDKSKRNLHDPAVISVIASDFLVWKVLVDQGSSANVMFYPTLEKMRINENSFHPYHRDLVGFSDERVNVRSYLWLTTTIGSPQERSR